MTTFEIYLIFNASTIRGFLLGLAILFSVMFFLCGFGIDEEENEEKRLELNKSDGINFFIALILFLLYAIVPSTKTALAMAVIPKLTSPEMVSVYKQDGGQLLDLTKDLIKQYSQK